MDPRPYHFDYRRPRMSNPTLYTLLHAASPKNSTTAFSNNNSNLPHLPLPKNNPALPPTPNCKTILTKQKSEFNRFQLYQALTTRQSKFEI